MKKLIVLQLVVFLTMNLIGVLLLSGCSKKVQKQDSILDIALNEPEQAVDNGKPLLVVGQALLGESEPEPKFSTVYFDFDSDVLKPEECFKIDAMNLIGNDVFIVGGACPIGDDKYNYELGMRRALAVFKYLTTVLGVENVKWRSCGENELISSKKSKYALNRRCEIRTN